MSNDPGFTPLPPGSGLYPPLIAVPTTRLDPALGRLQPSLDYVAPHGTAGVPLVHTPVARLLLTAYPLGSKVNVTVTLDVTGPDGSLQSWLQLDSPTFTYAPAIRTQSIGGGLIGSFIDGTQPTASGTAPAPGVYLLTVTATVGASSSPGRNVLGTTYTLSRNPLLIAPGSTVPGSNPPALALTWFQARELAFSGVQIRRAGWADRYLEYREALWWLQAVNPQTQVLGSTAVVTAPGFTGRDFLATDWTAQGSVDPALLSDAEQITTVFPAVNRPA